MIPTNGKAPWVKRNPKPPIVDRHEMDVYFEKAWIDSGGPIRNTGLYFDQKDLARRWFKSGYEAAK